MGTDVAVFQYLLGLYVVVMLCNVALSGALYWKNRSQLYRALLALWVSGAFAFAAQGVLIETPFLVALGFSAVFPTNLALAHLVALATGVPLSWKPFALALFVAVLLSVGIGAAGAGFTLTSLPIAVAVAAPTLFTSLRAIRTRWKGLRISARALVLSAIAFTAHNLDFPFLRDVQPFATFGFTIAFVIVFALSITGPAAALELVTEREARLAHELDTARKIQTKILPQDTELPGLEVVSYLRPAESVGGDYLDLYAFGNDSWLLVGDVTGHGLGAGLVMLMAQSTLSSILQTRPNVSPSELNWLANRVLCRNLARLEESRHMTVVSLRRQSGNRFTISGCHEDLLIVRASGAIERREVTHLPMGLGFTDEIRPEDVGEDSFVLDDGDLLYVGTDGITEAARGGDARRGFLGDGLPSLLARRSQQPLQRIKQALLDELERFTAGIYHDDVAFVLVRARASRVEAMASRSTSSDVRH
jgi:serine phosphatase RsbU (regulator of sigma subunit)